MKRLLPVISLLVLMAATAAACGGDDNSSAASTSQPQATGGTAQPSGEASPAATRPAGTAQITGSGADALRQLSKELSGKTYQVTYDFNFTQKGTPTKGSVTLAQKPPKSSTNFQLEGAGNFLTINDGTYDFTCSQDPSGKGQCVKTKGGASANPLLNAFSLDAVLKNLTGDLNVSDAGNRSIAGADSRCFTVKQANSSDSTACFSKKDGIVTLIDSKAADGGTTLIQATKVSSSVDDSLFAPPSGYTTIDNTKGQ